MFKRANGSAYGGPMLFNAGHRNPAWNKLLTKNKDLMVKLASSFRALHGAKILLIGVGTGNAAFEVELAHCLALLGYNLRVVCIDPCKIATFTDGFKDTKIPFIEPDYASVGEFIKDRAKYEADVTILSMIWPNPHFVQEEEGTYDMEAVEQIKPDYIVTMYSTSANNVAGTVQYTAAMTKYEALYKIAFKGFVTELSIERISVIEKLIKLIELADKKCDEVVYTVGILKQLDCKKTISSIWYESTMSDIRQYINLCYRFDTREVLDIIISKLDDFKQNIVIDAELKLIKLK